MPRAVGPRLKTMREPYHRRGEPVSREVYNSDFEEKWKELAGRFYDMGLLFTSNPRSRMTKKALLKMFDSIWDLIPEQIQLIARKDLPEKMLYCKPEDSWKEEEDDG